MSEIRVNKIVNEPGTGAVELKEGATLPAGKTLSGDGNINITGDATIGGLLTYEDVTNIDAVGLITARGGIHVLAGISTFKGAHFDGGQLIKETFNFSALDFNTDNQINLDTGMVDYRSNPLSAVTSLDLYCPMGVNNKMSAGEAITVNAITDVDNASYYINGLTIDGGSAETINWVSGVPTDGGSSGVDIYTFTILKTGDAEFLVIGNQTKTS